MCYKISAAQIQAGAPKWLQLRGCEPPVALTCWLGKRQSTEVMLLAYCAITFRMDFSTASGILPEMLVMISCSSSSGRAGSRRVFISCATHSFTCRSTSWCCWTCPRGNWVKHLLPGTHLGLEVGLGQAVAVHDVGQVVQHVAENLVLLLTSDGEGLLGWEPSCEWLCLEGAEGGC